MGILVIALIMSVSILIFLIYRYGKLYNKSQELLNISIAQTDDALELVSFYKKSIADYNGVLEEYRARTNDLENEIQLTSTHEKVSVPPAYKLH
jgi:cell division protein FtsB